MTAATKPDEDAADAGEAAMGAADEGEAAVGAADAGEAAVGAADEGGVSDLCFAARALAQSHAMTEAAHRYRQECVESERSRQRASELADWAGTALLVGYCLRRTEEQRVGTEPPAEAAPAGGEIDLVRVAALSEALRVGDADRVSLLPAQVTVAALDRIIATELDKRQEHLREQLDDEGWSELEDYIAWWVIHGYALRASECAAR